MLIAIYSIILFLLLLCSMFFSSADMAFGSVSLAKLEKKSNTKMGKIAYSLAKGYEKTISTILLWNDVINAALDTLSTLLGINVAISILNITDKAMQENIGLIFSLIFLILKIIFGEIIAKSLGKVFNGKLTIAYAYPLRICFYLTLPITFLMGGFGTLVTYPLTHNLNDFQTGDEELHEMVDEIEEKGQIDEQAAELLRGTIDYATTEAYEIMTPRAKIYGIFLNDDLEEILSNKETFSHSRLPIFNEENDQIIGFVKNKNLMKLKLEGKEEIPLGMIEKVIYIPHTIEINDILNKMREEKVAMSVVLDEYGAYEGIITFEDIVEEIVGEIWDEKDKADEPYSLKGDGSYIVDGSMTLRDFCSLFDLDFDEIETEYVTIGGFCIDLLGDRFAKVGDAIEYKNLKITILSMDGVKVKKMLVKKEEE
ncbi:MAG TPA: hypothetical protein DCR94_06075 [Firmicutes bacterium]|nr:hypothetical protein [Bacillota bacterium]